MSDEKKEREIKEGKLISSVHRRLEKRFKTGGLNSTLID